MSVNTYVQIIEQLLLEQRERTGYSDADMRMQLVYDRGYLLGLLAMLADHDSYNAHHIVSRLKSHKKKK